MNKLNVITILSGDKTIPYELYIARDYIVAIELSQSVNEMYHVVITSIDNHKTTLDFSSLTEAQKVIEVIVKGYEMAIFL